MERPVALLATLLLLLVAGCSTPTTGSVEPGDGPAATAEPSELVGGDGDYVDESEETTEPSAEPSEQAPANFKEKYTYPDGVEVEVTRVKKGKLTAADVEAFADGKVGSPWQELTVRVRNGSDARLTDLYSNFSVVYGPDGDSAEPVFVPSAENVTMSGTILPGKAKVASQTFAIPTKYLDDVVLEYSVDLEHEPAIFAGSLK